MLKFNPLLFSGLDLTGGSPSPTIGTPVIGADNDSVLIVDNSGNLADVPLSNGQIVIGRTGNTPIAGTLTGTSNQVIVTTGSGTITLALPQSIATTSSPTFNSLTLTNPLTTGNGGTGLNSTPTNGQLLIGNGSGYTLSTITGTTNQVSIANGTGSVTLSLPQDIATTSSPHFANLNLTPSGAIDVTSTGTLAIGTSNANVINIGNSGATVNIQGTTLYENVTQLQVTDPLITLNKGGGTGSASNSGIELEENAVITAFVETSADRNSWTFKAPNTAGIATVTPGSSGITLNQSSHNPVTLGTANGLSLSTQVLSLGLSSSSTTGALSSTDWSTFNNKQSALTLGNLTDSGTDGITVTGGTSAVVGSGASISQHVADATHNGYLSSTDWGTFNGKQGALTPGSISTSSSNFSVTNGASSTVGPNVTVNLTEGNLTESTSSVLTITGGTNAVLGSGASIQVKQASTSQSGYLSNTDWNTFNSKGSGTVTSVSVTSANGLAGTSSGGATPALTLTTTVTGLLKGNGTAISAAVSGTDYQAPGNYITTLTGDATATGPGSAVLTLATVNSNVGTFVSTTINAKGLVTAASNISGDATTSGAVLTLATVNSNTGSFGSASSTNTFTVNGKGLITSVTNNSIQITESQVTNLTTDLSNKASTTLNNLGTTAVNADINPGSLGLHLGNSTNYWNGITTQNVFGPSGTSSISLGNGQLIDSASNAQLTFNTNGITLPQLTASRALYLDNSNIVKSSATTNTELGYVSGVTSSIQTQLNGKQSTGNYITALTGDITATGPGSVTSTVSQIQGNTVNGTTGTNDVVFSTSPTLTNPVVGTQSQGNSSTKAASTAYVDIAVANAVSGINPAVAVQAATTSASDTSSYTYNNGVSGVGATLTGPTNTALVVDGYTFTTIGQRLLVKNDTQSPSGAYNGIYYVTQVQTAILPLVLTRALDYDAPSDINNTGAIPVINGTVNGTTSWVLISTVNTVGTDPLTYTEFTRNPADYLLKANNLSDLNNKVTAYSNIIPTGDIAPTTFSGLANNTANQTVTGLSFATTVSSFECFMNIQISATTPTYTTVKLIGTRQATSDWSVADLEPEFTGNAITGLSFSITSSGQVRVSIGNITGFSAGTVKFRAITLT